MATNGTPLAVTSCILIVVTSLYYLSSINIISTASTLVLDIILFILSTLGQIGIRMLYDIILPTLGYILNDTLILLLIMIYTVFFSILPLLFTLMIIGFYTKPSAESFGAYFDNLMRIAKVERAMDEKKQKEKEEMKEMKRKMESQIESNSVRKITVEDDFIKSIDSVELVSNKKEENNNTWSNYFSNRITSLKQNVYKKGEDIAFDIIVKTMKKMSEANSYSYDLGFCRVMVITDTRRTFFLGYLGTWFPLPVPKKFE